jgi:hypothetical protein
LSAITKKLLNKTNKEKRRLQLSEKKESRQSAKQPRDWKTFNKKWRLALDSVNKKLKRIWREK